jgi:hypothetical protein
MAEFPALDIAIPAWPGKSPPFSQSINPKPHRPETLGDYDRGDTPRTQFFEKYLVAMHLALSGPVPYAFRTADGAVRSLDAGCLGFLFHRSPPEVTFTLDSDGYIAGVTPGAALIARHAEEQDQLLQDIGQTSPRTSAWRRYAQAWPLLEDWNEDRGGPRPTLGEIEDAIYLMTAPGEPPHALNKGLCALTLGFRKGGSTAAQRAYASMTDSPYNNVGKLGDALREAYGTSKLESGRPYPLTMPGGIVSVTSDDSGHVRFEMLERLHPSSDYAEPARVLDIQALPDATVLTDLASAGNELADVSETEREALIKARLGQGQFRADLIAYWGGCAVTELRFIGMLRASHIKPWCKSDNKERLDKFNGLLLTPNLDQAFDAGLISFDDEGAMLVSPLLDEGAAQALGIAQGTRLQKLDSRHQPYLSWHRENLFRHVV